MAKKKHRDYQNDLPSVTTIIGQLQSYGLMNWFKVTPLEEINRVSKRGREIGTQMHSVIQEFLETGTAKIDTEYPEEINTALQSFMLFKKEHPEFYLKRSEIQMTSEKYGVNGTTDCLALRDGQLLIVDWKSANAGSEDKPKIYSEARIQVAAYCKMLNDVEGKEIKNALVVAIAKDKVCYNTYELNEEEIEGQFNEVFLPLVKIWRYKNEKRNL